MKVNTNSNKRLTEALKKFSDYSEGLRNFVMDVLSAYGIIPAGPDTREFPKSWSNNPTAKEAIKTIGDEIVNGYCDFKSLDSAIETILDYYYTPAIPKTADITYTEAENDRSKRINVSPEQFSEALIAALVTSCNWYIPDIIPDNQARQDHINQVKTNTLFGRLVTKFRRWESQVNEDDAKAANKATRTQNTNRGTRTTSSGTPRTTRATSTGNPSGRKDDYKYLGPLSGQVRDLKGNPGEKIYLQNVFFITGPKYVNSNRVTPYAFIKNITTTAGGNIGGNVGSTNQVFYGSANGYRQYPVFFDNAADADAFLGEVLNKVPRAPHVPDPFVARTKVDPNGYFKVGTEFGDVYIRASKLNEDLSENLDSEDSEIKANKIDISAVKEEVEERLKHFKKLPDDMLENYND